MNQSTGVMDQDDLSWLPWNMHGDPQKVVYSALTNFRSQKEDVATSAGFQSKPKLAMIGIKPASLIAARQLTLDGSKNGLNVAAVHIINNQFAADNPFADENDVAEEVFIEVSKLGVVNILFANFYREDELETDLADSSPVIEFDGRAYVALLDLDTNIIREAYVIELDGKTPIEALAHTAMDELETVAIASLPNEVSDQLAKMGYLVDIPSMASAT